MSGARASIATLACVAALAAVAAALLGGGAVEIAPDAAAATPQERASQIAANDAELRRGIDEWRTTAGDPPAAPPPPEVMAAAAFLQEQIRFLAGRRAEAKATIAALPSGLRRQVKDLVSAARKLRRLSKGAKNRRLKTGEPESLANLVAHYRKAKRRYRIGTHYLAAINHVETKFGRVKSKSVAGARGPMQFIPSTWRIYGKGSIHDPHDSIQAAARLLRDRGAPRSYRRALFAYNNSKLYVQAVRIYARLIARDPDALEFLYCWGP